ncbi:hypothetical protein NQL31_003703 [Lotmaria passim]
MSVGFSLQAAGPAHAAPTSLSSIAVAVVLTFYLVAFSTVVLALLRRRQAVKQQEKAQRRRQQLLNFACTEQQKQEDEEAEVVSSAFSLESHHVSAERAALHLRQLGDRYMPDVSRAATRHHHLEAFRALSSLVKSSSDTTRHCSASDGEADDDDDDDKDSRLSVSVVDVERRNDNDVQLRRATPRRTSKGSGRSSSDAGRRRRLTPPCQGYGTGATTTSSIATTASTVACALQQEQPEARLSLADHDDSHSSCQFGRGLSSSSVNEPHQSVQRHPRICHQHQRSFTSPQRSFGVSRVTSPEEPRGVKQQKGEEEDEEEVPLCCSPLDDVYGHTLRITSVSSQATSTVTATAVKTSPSSSSSFPSSSVSSARASCVLASIEDTAQRARQVASIERSLAYEADDEAEQDGYVSMSVTQAMTSKMGAGADTQSGSTHEPQLNPSGAAVTETRVASPAAEVTAVHESIEIRDAADAEEKKGDFSPRLSIAERQGGGLLMLSSYRCRRTRSIHDFSHGDNDDEEDEREKEDRFDEGDSGAPHMRKRWYGDSEERCRDESGTSSPLSPPVPRCDTSCFALSSLPSHSPLVRISTSAIMEEEQKAQEKTETITSSLALYNGPG